LANPLLPLRRLAHQALEPLRDQRPASRLIRRTARQEWRLITLNMVCSLLQATAEGATLGVMFLAVDLLSKPQGSVVDWTSKPLLAGLPQLSSFLNNLPPLQIFLILLGLAVALKLAQSLAMYVGTVAVGYYASRTSSRLTSILHSQVLGFSFPCASRYRVGDLQYINGIGPSTVINEINGLSSLVSTILMLGTYFLVLISLSTWLLVAAMVMAGILTLVQQQLLPRIRARALTATELSRELSSRMTENIQGLRLLHSSGQLGQADEEVRRQARAVEINNRSQIRLLAVNGPIIMALPMVMIAMIAALSLLIFGSRSSGVLPSLVTFVVALQRLNGSIGSLTQNLVSLKNNSANLDALNNFLIDSDKQFRRKGGLPFSRISKAITLDHVSLSYSSDLEPALTDVSLVIPKGHTVALVGTSGAGKSSIADLLTGLYDPTQGRIMIDDIDLSELDLATWQQRLGVVSQDTFLFNTSIANNIAFGTANASPAAIEEAAAKAQALQFIQALPDGLNTLIGERGYRLSGGQRQRLSLARAIMRDPELMILDEATSALDSESEKLVQEAIDQFERKHTMLIIAHRLSTIMNADLICVMHKGRIIERGSHQQLLRDRKRYAHLWLQQTTATSIEKNEA
jgi:subfamily B ATP-binding cassette protein MsbA